jgi:hypothetical protein
MCLFGAIYPNNRYTPNKKNGGIIPPVYDDRILSVAIGCGNCIECRKQKARDWQVRLQEDIKTYTNGKMITLTFSNTAIQNIDKQIPTTYQKYNKLKKTYEDYPLIGYKRDNAIAKYAVHHFRERWRKENKTSIRHWLITELGHRGTENIHMHGIVWTDEPYFIIRSKWAYGHIWPRPGQENKTYVNEKTINYTIKYVHKIDWQHRYYKPAILTSPGIGANYIGTYNANRNKFNEEGDTIETYKTTSGHNIAMPTYWRNKIYNDDEREKLWLIMLDKNERWICGEKVDITKGSEDYFNILKYHRERNKQLGYGDNKKEWSRIEEEEARRIYLLKKRMEKT